MADQQVRERQSEQREDVRGSGIYPATGPRPGGDAVVRTAGALGHPEARRVTPSRDAIEKGALVAGRIIFGGYFFYSGLNHFLQRRLLVEYARSKGVPAPEAAVAGSGLLALAGGLSILIGTWPKMGAGLISTFLLGVSPQMHAFWREQEPQRMHEMVNFTKNMALIGASCLAAARPEPWPLSMTLRRHHALPARL